MIDRGVPPPLRWRFDGDGAPPKKHMCRVRRVTISRSRPEKYEFAFAGSDAASQMRNSDATLRDAFIDTPQRDTPQGHTKVREEKAKERGLALSILSKSSLTPYSSHANPKVLGIDTEMRYAGHHARVAPFRGVGRRVT